MFKILFFVPETHKEIVKSQMFLSGAGKMGNYDSCSWEVLGEGQFRPMDGSNPFIGKQGVVEKVKEFKVEMCCDAEYIEQAIKALKDSHPYEWPAYDVFKMEEF